MAIRQSDTQEGQGFPYIGERTGGSKMNKTARGQQEAAETKKDIIQEVRAQMEQIIAAHEKEVNACKKNIADTQERIAAADRALKAATDKTDFDEYAAAKREKEQAQTALEMYTAKLQQVEAAGYIAEDESDRTIEKVFQYEDDITAAYLQDAAPHIAALNALAADYNAALEDTHEVLTAWTAKVHAYYKGGVKAYRDGVEIKTPRSIYRKHGEAFALNRTTEEYSHIAALTPYIKAAQTKQQEGNA